jgi:cytosine/adenosine deaminase-related metal-dependent hydrolase
MTGNAEVSARFKVIQTLVQDGFLGPDIQIIHAVHATPQDIEALAQSRTHVSVSPNAEAAGMGVPPVNAFRKAGVLVNLSIDNTALPESVDPFALMRQLITLLRQGCGAEPAGLGRYCRSAQPMILSRKASQASIWARATNSLG